MENNTPTINYDDNRMIHTLKATVAQGLSEPEFRLFAEHCKSTGLNPFKKEVWAIKAGGRLQVMTGINGFLAIANNHPQFDGMETEVDNDNQPTKAICRVYRKDRRFPSEGIALMKEYGKDTPIWRQMPRVMLTKVAKSIALREAFPQELNGLYTAEEMPSEYDVPKAPKAPIKVAQEPTQAPQREPQQVEVEVEPVEEQVSETRYYKIYPKMERFQELKAIIKDAGGRWNAEGKCWTLDHELPELSGQECDSTGQWLNSKRKTVSQNKPEPENIPNLEEPMINALDDIDISFEDDDYTF